MPKVSSSDADFFNDLSGSIAAGPYGPGPYGSNADEYLDEKEGHAEKEEEEEK